MTATEPTARQRAEPASAARPRRVSSWRPPTPSADVLWSAGVGAAVAAVYTLFSAWQWAGFAIKSWDLAIFTQLLKQYASLSAPIVNIKGDGFNLLGDHFHPLLAVLAPIYAVFPHAFTLLVVQNLCFGVAAALITHSARRILGPIPGTLFGLAFGLSWGLQYAVEAQFHEISLAVPLLAASLTAFLDGRWRRVALWAGLLVFVKEDLGLTVAAIGIVLALRSRRPLGLWLAVWGVGWFLLAMFVILPALNPNGTYAYSGTVSGEALEPAALFNPAKGETAVLLLAVTAGIALRSPLALILLPTLAWRFLSSNHGYWGPTWHYSAVLMPIAFAAALDGIRLAAGSARRWLRQYATHSAVLAVIVAAILIPRTPLAGLLASDWFTPTLRTAAAGTVLDAVPEGATVESDIGLMSYLADEHDVYWIGNRNPAPDCVLIYPHGGGTPADWGGVLQVAARVHSGVEYVHVRDAEGYQLACTPAALVD